MELFWTFIANFIITLANVATLLLIGATLWQLRPFTSKELFVLLAFPVVVVCVFLRVSFTSDGFDPFLCLCGLSFAFVSIYSRTYDRIEAQRNIAKNEAKKNGTQPKPLFVDQVVHALIPIVFLGLFLCMVSIFTL